MKATEQYRYFPVVLFIKLDNLGLSFESVDEILKCDHSNESYWTVLTFVKACLSIIEKNGKIVKFTLGILEG